MEQQIIIQSPISEEQFSPVVNWIRDAHHQVYSYANRALIDLYWQIGQYLSEQTQNGGWGKSVVKSLSEYIQQTEPGAEGFSAQNLWRMKQFYETYRGNEKLSTLLRDLSWSNNLLIMNRSLSPAMVAEYQLQLPDKKLLQTKMQELFQYQN